MSRRQKLFWWVAAVIFITTILIWAVNSRTRSEYSKRVHCISNLSFIRQAKVACQEDLSLKEGDPVPPDALEKELTNAGTALAKLKCPNRGVYVIGHVGTTPQCSYTNFSYTWELQGNPPWLKRKVWRHSIGP